jgi:hypothetical protein
MKPMPVKVESGDALGLIRRDLPAHVGEGFLLAEPLDQVLAFASRAVFERCAELLHRALCVRDLGRHGVDRVGVHARRQDPAAAVEDVAALGRHGLRAHLLALGPRHEIRPLEELQVDQTCFDAPDPRRRRHCDDGDALSERDAPVHGSRSRH